MLIENAGDHGIGVVGCEPADQIDSVLVGAYGRWLGTRQADLEFGEHATLPAKREIDLILIAIDGDDDLLE